MLSLQVFIKHHRKMMLLCEITQVLHSIYYNGIVIFESTVSHVHTILERTILFQYILCSI